ncbi:UNVERIFIED_CONTAM: hypothetical protein K2H54_016832 [Gekko kuhli]
MIEAQVDVKTTDGYLLHFFCVGFTKKRNNQIRKTSYAWHQQVQQIRKKRKVKMFKKPRFELGKLIELNGETGSAGKLSGDETDTRATEMALPLVTGNQAILGLGTYKKPLEDD